jgi:hypothetical protein
VTVVAKERAVNSVFLVQLRKRRSADFWERIGGGNQRWRADSAHAASAFDCNWTAGKKSLCDDGTIVHRACTGNAERRVARLQESKIFNTEEHGDKSD